MIWFQLFFYKNSIETSRRCEKAKDDYRSALILAEKELKKYAEIVKLLKKQEIE